MKRLTATLREQIEEIIPDTVKDMQSFDLKRIVPAHCTGWRAVQCVGEGLRGRCAGAVGGGTAA